MPDTISATSALDEIKISELEVASQANDTDLLEASQVSSPGYVTRSITIGQIRSLLLGSVSPAVLTWMVTPNSANLRAAMTDETGSGGVLVFSDHPTITNPALHGGTSDQMSITNPSLDGGTMGSMVGNWAGNPVFTGDPRATTPPTTDNDTSLATTAFVRAAIATYSPAPDLSPYALINSPTFTGDPKAPTPATADNDTSIATTAYVKANIAALPAPPTTLPPSGAAGGALTGTYPNPTLVGGPLSNYAPLASPALTGVPTAPTAAPATNTTQLATTAFVAAAIASGASISVGVAPPGSPNANQLWWNSEQGTLSIYYLDPGGAPAQWVPAVPGGSMQSGALYLYSESVLAANATTMAVSFPTTARHVELEWDFQITPTSDPAVLLQGTSGGVLNATANYTYSRIYSSGTSGPGSLASDQNNGLTGFSIGGGFIGRGKANLTTPSKAWGVSQYALITSGSLRYIFNAHYETASITGLDGFRLTTVSNNFAAGSFLRAFVVQ